jgi:hypothetical protein
MKLSKKQINRIIKEALKESEYNMQLDRVALAVTRILNIIERYSGKSLSERGDLFEEIINNTLTTSRSKEAFADMIVAMTLLTSGNVESIRNPEKYNDSSAEPISEILSEPSMLALEIIGFDMSKAPEKSHYLLAKSLLPIMGSSNMPRDEVLSVFGKSGVLDADVSQAIQKNTFETEGYDYLYRGLHSLQDDSFLSLMKIGSVWDMTRGVSTTDDYRSAMGFKEQKQGHRALLSIINPDKKGFVAQGLSKFSSESEVIFSGKVKIESYTLNFYCEFYDMENTEETRPMGSVKFEMNSNGMIMGRVDNVDHSVDNSYSVNNKLIYHVSNVTQEEQMKFFEDLHKKGEYIITAGDSWNIAKPLRGHKLKLKTYGKYGDINVVVRVV